MSNRDEQPKPNRGRDPRLLAAVAAVGLLLFGLATWLTAPDTLPTKSNPGFLDVLIDAPAVVAAGRVALVAAAAYVTLSIVWLVSAGQPLIKFGPAEAAPLIEEAEQEAEKLRQEVARLQKERDKFLNDARSGWDMAQGLLKHLGDEPRRGGRIDSGESGQ
jgi:hypothetical protein